MEAATANRKYRLTRNFAIGALVVVLIAAAGLAFRQRSFEVDQLQRMAAENHGALTQALANGLWQDFAPFIEVAQSLSADEIRVHPGTARLSRAVETLVNGTRVLKVKLYGVEGLTFFSTEPAQIGSDYSTNARFVKALGGATASKLDLRESFNAIGGVVQDRRVLSSYVPIRPGGAAAPIEGVAEIYSDVTDLYHHITWSGAVQSAIVGLAFVAVFVLLVALIWRADRMIQQEHARNLKLAASAAKAESASEAKTAFLANMGHELRTPLNAIIGFSQLIRDGSFGPLGDPRYKDYAADINGAGQHLLALINDVLDLVKIESGTMALTLGPTDPAEVARDAFKMLRETSRRADVTLALELDPDLPTIESDEGKIRQILVNLVSNAIKFSAAGGRVSVGLAGVQDAKHGRGMRITVQDQGIGMAEEELPLALAPFGQVDASVARRHEGGGLGLPLSKHFAELLGGRLEIDSRPEAGTRVTVDLPDLSARREAETESPPALAVNQ